MVTNRLKFSLKSRNQKTLCIKNNKPKTIPHTHARTLVRIAYLLEIHGVARLICSYSPNHLDTGEWPVHLVANVTFYFSPSRAIVLDIRIVNYFCLYSTSHIHTRAHSSTYKHTHECKIAVRLVSLSRLFRSLLLPFVRIRLRAPTIDQFSLYFCSALAVFEFILAFTCVKLISCND